MSNKSKLKPTYPTEELYNFAVDRSKELFGKVNYSGYVQHLIAQDKRLSENIEIDLSTKDDKVVYISNPTVGRKRY